MIRAALEKIIWGETRPDTLSEIKRLESEINELFTPEAVQNREEAAARHQKGKEEYEALARSWANRVNMPHANCTIFVKRVKRLLNFLLNPSFPFKTFHASFSLIRMLCEIQSQAGS